MNKAIRSVCQCPSKASHYQRFCRVQTFQITHEIDGKKQTWLQSNVFQKMYSDSDQDIYLDPIIASKSRPETVAIPSWIGCLSRTGDWGQLTGTQDKSSHSGHQYADEVLWTPQAKTVLLRIRRAVLFFFNVRQLLEEYKVNTSRVCTETKTKFMQKYPQSSSAVDSKSVAISELWCLTLEANRPITDQHEVVRQEH